MSGNHSFLKNAVIYGLGGVAMQLASVVLLPLYTHYLSPADYGVLEILDRTGQIIVLLLLGNGVRMATFSFYCQANTPEERRQTFSSIAVVLWTILAIGALLSVALSPLLASALQIGNPLLVLLGIGVVLLQGLVALPLALMQARVESLSFVISNLLLAITRMTLIIVAVAWLGLGIWGVLGASSICLGLYAVVLTTREVVGGFSQPNYSTIVKILKFSVPLLPSGILALALTSADRFFLLNYTSAKEVGTYSFGYKIAVLIPLLVTTPLWKVWTAELYAHFKAPDASLSVGRVITRILAVRVFMGLGVCLFSREIVELLAPNEYQAATLVIPLLTVSSTLELATNLFEGSFWSEQKTKWKPIIMAFSAVTALISLWVLVPPMGSMGAAIAAVIAFGVHATITFFVTQRIFYVSYDRSAVLLSVGMATTLYLASEVLEVGAFDFFLKVGLWCSWPLLLWWLGLIQEEEKDWSRRQVGRMSRAARRFLPGFSSR